jgi:putative ABC transport system substrate-binding protein
VTTRREFIVTLAGGLLAAPLVAEAQHAGKVYRIGFLLAGRTPAQDLPKGRMLLPGLPGAPHLIEAFRQELRERGWVEGQNIVIDFRFAEGRLDRLPDLAAELVRLKVDIIVTMTTYAAVAAKNATATIPIVMIDANDPVGVGLIASLARPGGNVTGLSSNVGPEIVGKQLGLLKEVVPKVRQVAVLSNADNPFHALAIREVKDVARSLGVQPQILEVRRPTEFDGAFAAMAKERVGALLVVGDFLMYANRARLAALAAGRRLPAAYSLRDYAEAGGLMSYGTDLIDLNRRAAIHVDKILKGAKPADLPVEQPTKFELVINLKTAKALGLTIPPSLLARADEVIQ